jgi:hypothetical protein
MTWFSLYLLIYIQKKIIGYTKLITAENKSITKKLSSHKPPTRGGFVAARTPGEHICYGLLHMRKGSNLI